MKLKNRFEIRLRYQSFNKDEPEVLKKKIQDLSGKIFSFSSIRLPIKKKRMTLLRSPHVNKKSRDQLEVRFYNGLFLLKGNSLNMSFLETVKRLSTPQIALKFSVHTLSKTTND